MIDYLAAFTNTNGLAFPDTLGKNATGPGATDGTEFTKTMVDDEWGARYALLDHVSLTPNGVTEGPGVSQVIDAMNLMAGAPGTGCEWLLSDDPGTTGHRALLRQGQGVLIATYPLLDAAVYVGDANNAAVAAGGGAFYRASDAAGTTPNIAGPYLILDDTRGVVPRGLDTAAAIDPDGASRYLGDLQADAMQRITGEANVSATTGIVSDATGIADGVFSKGTGYVNSPNATANACSGLAFDSADSISPNPAKTDDVETRMYNRSTVHVIWY